MASQAAPASAPALAPERGKRGKLPYPGKVAIRHALESAKEFGLDVAGYEIAPDGTIRVMEARAMPKQTEDLFDQLDAAGKL